MKNTFTFAAMAAFLLVSCAGGSNQNQNNDADSSVAATQDTTTVVEPSTESNVYADTVFAEDVALKVYQLKKLKGYNYEKNRTQNQYASLSAWCDGDDSTVEIECFKRKDGAVSVYVAIYQEAEGDRSYIESNWYLLKDNQLTKNNEKSSFAGHRLDWFCDELGKLDFINNEHFMDGNQTIWEEFSDQVANGELQISRTGANTLVVKAFDHCRAISPVLMDWNGEEFVKRTPQIKYYIHDDSFGPIYCADKFPDLSSLKEYKTTNKDGKIQLLKNNEMVAEFTLKNNLVKDFEVFSSEYYFWQGWGPGMSAEDIYKHFNKIEKDEKGHYYVPWFESVRFYFNSADLQNSDLKNPQFVPGAKVTKVRVIGEEPAKATFALMPKKITVENYKDNDTWDKITTVYTLQYDDKHRLTNLQIDNEPYIQIKYTDNDVDVVRGKPHEEGEVEGEVYHIDGSNIYITYYGEDGEAPINFENGHIKSISNEVDDWCKYTWEDDLIKSIEYNMENLIVSFEYERGDVLLDHQVIDLEYLIREGCLDINQSTFFTATPIRCRSEKLPKKIIYDGSNVKAEISIGYIFGSDNKIERINCSDYKYGNRMFNRSIVIEY